MNRWYHGSIALSMNFFLCTGQHYRLIGDYEKALPWLYKSATIKIPQRSLFQWHQLYNCLVGACVLLLLACTSARAGDSIPPSLCPHSLFVSSTSRPRTLDVAFIDICILIVQIGVWTSADGKRRCQPHGTATTQEDSRCGMMRSIGFFVACAWSCASFRRLA
jgi:hypothetical protein